jgi:HNH endonuclease
VATSKSGKTPARLQDMTGRVFGMLTVLKRAPGATKAGGPNWECRCKCGQAKVATAGGLLRGNPKSCGRHRREWIETRTPNLMGKKFGRLTVVRFDGYRWKKAYWLARCDCGKEVAVSGNALKTGNNTACGSVKCRPGFKGWSSQHGYRLVYVGDGRYAMEHRVVMERVLGRKLRPEENVHHANGNRSDNRVENLELWSRAQPTGQRVVDKVAYAKEILKLYEPSALAAPNSTINHAGEQEPG